MKKMILSIALIGACMTSQAQSLVAHWDFSGGVATDISGNGLNGIPFNTLAASGRAGTPNTALKFNGINSGVDVPYQPIMNLEQFSIVAVVKVDGFNGNPCQGNTIISRSGGGSSSDHYDLLLTDNMNDGSCAISTPTQTLFTGNAPGTNPNPAAASVYSPFTDTGRWYCVALTYDKRTLSLYVDGVLQVSLPWTHNYITSSAPISIGYFVTGLPSYPYYFNGVIDDLQLWDGPLSPDEIIKECAECKVENVEYCTSVASPGHYTFTPTITPATANVRWDFSDGTVLYSTAGTPVSHTFHPGDHSVCVTVLQNGDMECATYCFDICVPHYEYVEEKSPEKHATSVSDLNDGQIIGEIYPNPTNSELNIPVKTQGKITVTIRGVDGTRHTSQVFELDGETNVITMPASNLVPGTYFVEVAEGTTRNTRSFVKY